MLAYECVAYAWRSNLEKAEKAEGCCPSGAACEILTACVRLLLKEKA